MIDKNVLRTTCRQNDGAAWRDQQEKLANWVREIFATTQDKEEEKKMYSRICCMVNDKICAGIQKDQLMVTTLARSCFDQS